MGAVTGVCAKGAAVSDPGLVLGGTVEAVATSQAGGPEPRTSARTTHSPNKHPSIDLNFWQP